MPGHAYSTSYLPSLSFEASGEHLGVSFKSPTYSLLFLAFKEMLNIHAEILCVVSPDASSFHGMDFIPFPC